MYIFVIVYPTFIMRSDRGSTLPRNVQGKIVVYTYVGKFILIRSVFNKFYSCENHKSEYGIETV